MQTIVAPIDDLECVFAFFKRVSIVTMGQLEDVVADNTIWCYILPILISEVGIDPWGDWCVVAFLMESRIGSLNNDVGLHTLWNTDFKSIFLL